MEMGRIKMCAFSRSHFCTNGIKLHYEIPDITHCFEIVSCGCLDLMVKAIKCDGFPVSVASGRINLGNDWGVIEIDTRC